MKLLLPFSLTLVLGSIFDLIYAEYDPTDITFDQNIAIQTSHVTTLQWKVDSIADCEDQCENESSCVAWSFSVKGPKKGTCLSHSSIGLTSAEWDIFTTEIKLD